MKKKDCAIVFGITQDYTFALANVLIGMKKHCTKVWDDIIVYHNGISDENKFKLNKILKCKFVEFNTQLLEIDKDHDAIKEYSLMAMARFECFKLLNDYKKVIWHDVDILVQKDFSSLLAYGEISGFAATITDSNFLVESNFKGLIEEYDMFVPLHNSGILVLSEKLKNYNDIYDYCYATFNKYAERLRYPDQGVINLLIQDFDIPVEEIDIKKFCCFPKHKEAKDAIIVHAYGQEKFWNSNNVASTFPEWKMNNEEWLSISAKNNNFSSNSPLVSVVMSTYNRNAFLAEAIESILNQTYSNFEIIMVIEHSEIKNEVKEQLEKYNDKRIKIITNKKRLGFAASLNVGLQSAKGKYIARMDDDDISLPHRLEKQVFYMEENPEVGICGSYIEFFMGSSGILSIPTDNDQLKAHCLSATPFYHPTVIMRKSELDKYNLKYNPDYFTEDYELWSRAAEFLIFHNIPEVLLKYRASGENLSLLNSMKVHSSHIKVMENQFIKYLDMHPTNNELQLFNSRINIFDLVCNSKEAHKMATELSKKILDQNKKTNFYNETSLKKVLKVDYHKNNTSSWKKAIKVLLLPLKPFYRIIMNRIYWMVKTEIAENNLQIFEKITDLKKQIELIKK